MINLNSYQEGMELGKKEIRDLFIAVNKAENYLYNVIKNDIATYRDIKSKVRERKYHVLDKLVFKSVFVQDPREVRVVLEDYDYSQAFSDFNRAVTMSEKIKDPRVEEALDWTKVDGDMEIDRYILYLNYFTRFAGRTGGKVDIHNLSNMDYFNSEFISNKSIAEELNFMPTENNQEYILYLNRVGDFDKYKLQQKINYIKNEIDKMEGVLV